MIPLPQAQFGLPQASFDSLIGANGVRLLWRKSHVCPCTYSSGGLGLSGVAGSGQPSCQTCRGVGIYWDNAVGPFTALVTFMSMTRSPDEPGAKLDEVYGQVLSGSPSITVAESLNPTVWANASVDDQFIEIDAPARFNAILMQGVQNYIPFFEDLTVAASGAVTTWDSINNIVVPVSGYTVTGNQVQTNLPVNSPFIVEFQATNIYLLFRKPGGQVHARPFGIAQAQQLPRRFQAQQIDTWIRARSSMPDAVAGQTQAVSGASLPIITTVGRI